MKKIIFWLYVNFLLVLLRGKSIVVNIPSNSQLQQENLTNSAKLAPKTPANSAKLEPETLANSAKVGPETPANSAKLVAEDDNIQNINTTHTAQLTQNILALEAFKNELSKMMVDSGKSVTSDNERKKTSLTKESGTNLDIQKSGNFIYDFLRQDPRDMIEGKRDHDISSASRGASPPPPPVPGLTHTTDPGLASLLSIDPATVTQPNTVSVPNSGSSVFYGPASPITNDGLNQDSHSFQTHSFSPTATLSSLATLPESEIQGYIKASTVVVMGDERSGKEDDDLEYGDEHPWYSQGPMYMEYGTPEEDLPMARMKRDPPGIFLGLKAIIFAILGIVFSKKIIILAILFSVIFGLYQLAAGVTTHINTVIRGARSVQPDLYLLGLNATSLMETYGLLGTFNQFTNDMVKSRNQGFSTLGKTGTLHQTTDYKQTKNSEVSPILTSKPKQSDTLTPNSMSPAVGEATNSSSSFSPAVGEATNSSSSFSPAVGEATNSSGSLSPAVGETNTSNSLPQTGIVATNRSVSLSAAEKASGRGNIVPNAYV